jgi:hypothetical protein
MVSERGGTDTLNRGPDIARSLIRQFEKFEPIENKEI